MSTFSLLTMRERKLQAAAICREIQGPDDMDVGRKVKAPKEIMLEELSLASNRGSRLFKLRQQRSEKYTYDSIQQKTHLNNGVCVPHGVESVEGEGGNHGDESSDPMTSADPDSIAPGSNGPLKDVPAERFNLMSIPSPWQQALGNDPSLTDAHLPSMPEPQPETPSYKSFNRVAIPFGGFERAAKLPVAVSEEAPPPGDELSPAAETITLRPKFNRTALGWISHGNPAPLPRVTLEPCPLPLLVPESEEL